MGSRELRLVVFTAAGTVAGVLIVVGIILFWMTRADAPTLAEEGAAVTAPAPVVQPAYTLLETARKPTVRRSAGAPKPVRRQPLIASRREVQETPAPIARPVTIPAGTRLDVVLGQRLSTETNQVGDTFDATLVRPVVISGETVLEQGATVTGRITNLERPGRATGVAKMTLALVSVYAPGENTVSLQTIPLAMEGKTTKAEDARDIGIGTGIGTIVGAIFGGKKGAAIGGTAGAGGGTATVLATRGEDLVLVPERELTFTLALNADLR